MPPYILRHNPSKDETEWKFTIPLRIFNAVPRNNPPDRISGKAIKVKADAISFDTVTFPTNRILQDDDPSKFITVTFNELRFPESTLREAGEYISRMLNTGIFINERQYRFYHHSNSQLRSRSCFVREASSDAELDARIYLLGDFGNIMNAAKRAKRIGLLFTSADAAMNVHPQYVLDIPDIESDGEVFSDGCGLISKRLAVQISKKRKIIFRGVRYTPSVYQIRYLGYKGVLMMHPSMDRQDPQHLIQFRKSMKKFTTTTNHSFSIANYSKPYSFGRLNYDVIALLSSLDVTDDAFLKKQREYHDWITHAADEPAKAFMFLSTLDKYNLAERVLLDGLSEPVLKAIRGQQGAEIASFRKEGRDADAEGRCRIIVEKSRRLFGVCDPFQILKEGEVHIRITAGRGGPTTPINADALVVRNPCLHPGDCLKLRAVVHNELSHLVDCIVFATVAKPGHIPAPMMSSGGDLDGDEYLVIWDPDLVPPSSYDYPAPKAPPKKPISRADLAQYFAGYSGSGVARVAKLHRRWLVASPRGARATECQELAALHSQVVDGASVKIPDRLSSPPDRSSDQPPFIISRLEEEASKFAREFLAADSTRRSIASDTEDGDDAISLIIQLLQNPQPAATEYELFQLAYRLSQKHHFDLAPFLNHFDFGAFSAVQKHTIIFQLEKTISAETHSGVWNSLLRSDFLSPRDMYARNLGHPYPIQRMYSSKTNGLATFFQYLKRATQEFTRKVLLIKTDDRFAVGIFMRGDIPWDDDPDVSENVSVCSFLPRGTSNFSTIKLCTRGYKLHLSDANLQLFDKQRSDSFIFLTRLQQASGAELGASIALQKISGPVQKQIGRIRRAPIVGMELHVVSNRDRVAHQLFDLWFEHTPTEQRYRRFEREVRTYQMFTLANVEWSGYAVWIGSLFQKGKSEEVFLQELSQRRNDELENIIIIGLRYHAFEPIYWTFSYIISQTPMERELIIRWVDQLPPLAFAFLAKYPPDPETGFLVPELQAFVVTILTSIIRCTNELSMATLVAIERLFGEISRLKVDVYADLLWLTALSVRAPQVVQEVLLMLNDSRTKSIEPHSLSRLYAHKQILGIAFEHAEEAAAECPCNDEGIPRKQRTPPIQVKVCLDPENAMRVKATVRIDSRTSARLHSHVRLQAASKEEKGLVIRAPVVDGIVVVAGKGELVIEVMHRMPPEMEEMEWNLYDAGSTATTKAMFDAVLRLVQDKSESCLFHHVITGEVDDDVRFNDSKVSDLTVEDLEEEDTLNAGQLQAIVATSRVPLTLIWGPPGTGKTTVIVQILRSMIQGALEKEYKILMTASTHNAVDNVLERFIQLNSAHNILQDQQILRAATDMNKVNPALQSYTVDARVGGDMNENNRLFKKAKERLDTALIVFTTCAGAGLGILRKATFEVVLIDEASQITEACALIPFTKGAKKGVLVGDHVQLRPTVQGMGKVLEVDVSLLERLYTRQSWNEDMMTKSMLNIQYRFPQELAAFPSREFYDNKLESGIIDSMQALEPLLAPPNRFPWPRDTRNVVVPTVFVPCVDEEDMSGRSKSNMGQVQLVLKIVEQLGSSRTVTVLSPYTKQIRELRNRLPKEMVCSTVDGFQGRESDIIVFSSVRSNVEGDIGFLDDARRLNVMWTRPKLGLIIVGHRETLEKNGLWKRALKACEQVNINATVPG